jgi:hypothetical protein
MKVFIFIALVAFANAELFDECENESDCDEKTETCVKRPTFEAPGEFEEKGKCGHKMREFEFCVFDSNCEEEHFCVRHPLLETPVPIIGRCVQCRSDDDCDTNDYCRHPVLNGHCLKTIFLKEKIDAAKMKHEERMEKFIAKKFGESDDEKDDEDRPHPDDDEDSPRGGEGRRGRFPNFPTFDRESRGGRSKRSLGDQWAINIPNLRCTPKSPSNAPCERSGECEAGTCTIEGFCQ